MLLQYQRHVLSEKFQISISNGTKSYGGAKNGMLYISENAKIINMQLTISVTDIKP